MQARKESIKPGAVFVKERAFTADDVRDFGRVSRDLGVHHVQPDAQGRVMLQGLLTATLATEIGGDLDFLASEMVLRFLRPVFTGDLIRCEVLDSQNEDAKRISLELSVSTKNQNGKEVMQGTIRGVILK
jgi:3-hydroxybutyryl-CoA dehydratase